MTRFDRARCGLEIKKKGTETSHVYQTSESALTAGLLARFI